jgi:hypothetical protein
MHDAVAVGREADGSACCPSCISYSYLKASSGQLPNWESRLFFSLYTIWELRYSEQRLWTKKSNGKVKCVDINIYIYIYIYFQNDVWGIYMNFHWWRDTREVQGVLALGFNLHGRSVRQWTKWSKLKVGTAMVITQVQCGNKNSYNVIRTISLPLVITIGKGMWGHPKIPLLASTLVGSNWQFI